MRSGSITNAVKLSLFSWILFLSIFFFFVTSSSDTPTLCMFFFAEDKLAFTVQILEEVAALFEEDHSSASWEENTVENFLNIVNKQAEELRSCVSSLSFGYSAEAWETIRNITKEHLRRCGSLVESLGNAH
uniref:Uncharacterized protein n=1 Tax=Haplochromis burtoni TaxID=8153 RepID=A0A3Q2WHI7_HAPBU